MKESEYLSLKGKALTFSAGKLQEAREAMEKAMELNPDNHEAVRDMGGVFWREGDHEKAAEMYEKALALNETDPK